MSWFSKEVHKVAGSLSQNLGDIGGSLQHYGPTILKLWAAYETGGASLLAEAGSGASSGLTSGSSILGSLYQDLGAGISKLASSTFSDYFSTAGQVLSSIHDTVDSVSRDIAAVIDPIQKTIHETASLAQAINDQIVGPIGNTIRALQRSYKAITDALHGEIGHGLTGLVSASQQISGALTSLDAQVSRGIQQMGTTNRDTAESVMAPAILQAGAHSIGNLQSAFASSEYSDNAKAVFEHIDRLRAQSQIRVSGLASALPPSGDRQGTGAQPFHEREGIRPTHETRTAPDGGPPPTLEQFVDAWETYIAHEDAWWAGMLRAAFGLLLAGTFVAEQISQEVKLEAQKAAASLPVERLGPGQTIEALRRGLITGEQAKDEMLAEGIDPSRQQVLYDLAQYLFSARETVELHARGIIDIQQVDTLRDQNNLSGGQYEALTELMAFLVPLADALSAWNRGYLDDTQLHEFMAAHRVRDQDVALIESLSLSPVPPRLAVDVQGRLDAYDQGLLQTTFGKPVPEALSKAYRAAEREEGEAVLDWLRHWRLPGAEWWVRAYFRGVRTREEVYEAMRANNVPEELWGDIFRTEEELPPVWLVPDIVASGVWSREQAVPALQKLGFSIENATVLYNYGLSKSKTSKAQTAGDLHKISLGNARRMFDDGILDAATYKQVLRDHGYSDEAATLTMDLADLELAQQQRKDRADYLVELVKLGRMTQADAVSNLYEIGFGQAEVTRYLDKIETERTINGKLPSRSEVGHMLKQGIVSTDVYLQTLELLGYSSFWAQAFLQLEG